jgi:hypothetical protein
MILAASVSFVVFACKKDRTCECTQSSAISSTEPNYPSSNSTQTSTLTYKKVKKSNVNIELCVSREITSSQTYTRTTGGVANSYERTTVDTYECVVK